MIDFLKSVPVFYGVDETILKSACGKFFRHAYIKNQTILESGDKGDFLGFVISGRVKVSIISESGKEIILDYLGRGECIGEMAIFDENKRSANVTASTPAVLALISRKDYLGYASHVPEISFRIASVMSKRLRTANRRFESMVSMPLIRRVADLLISCCDKSENYRVGYTQQEMGDLLGVHRESITRVLSKMKSQGILNKAPCSSDLSINRNLLEKIYLTES